MPFLNESEKFQFDNCAMALLSTIIGLYVFGDLHQNMIRCRFTDLSE